MSTILSYALARWFAASPYAHGEPLGKVELLRSGEYRFYATSGRLACTMHGGERWKAERAFSAVYSRRVDASGRA